MGGPGAAGTRVAQKDYRHTTGMLQPRFQTTAVKQVSQQSKSVGVFFFFLFPDAYQSYVYSML